MRTFRISIIGLAVATVCTFALFGKSSPSIANAQAPTAKIGYVPITGGEYRIDPAHSTIGFAIRHYEINWVSGRFKDFSGIIRYDESDVTKSSVEFTAKVESIDTGVAPRDNHLRTADFFDVAKYPEMSFKSTRVEHKADNTYILHGDFTLKGVTKQIAIPFSIKGGVKDPRGNMRFGIAGQTKIDRRDYGITWGKSMEGGGLDVGNEVTIDLNLEAFKAATKPAGQ